MVIRHDEVMEMIKLLAESRDLRVNGSYALVSGTLSATGFIVGALGGLPGMAIGTAVGAYLGYSIGSRKNCKSVVKYIQEDMTQDEREKLIDHFKIFLTSLDCHDVMTVIQLLQSSSKGELAVEFIFSYFKIHHRLILTAVYKSFKRNKMEQSALMLNQDSITKED